MNALQKDLILIMAKEQPGLFNQMAQLAQGPLSRHEIMGAIGAKIPPQSVTYGLAALALEFFRSKEGRAILRRLKKEGKGATPPSPGDWSDLLTPSTPEK